MLPLGFPNAIVLGLLAGLLEFNPVAGWMTEAGSPALANDEFAANLLKYLPYKRLVQPEELAGALLYLASPASGFVTGEAIAIDGGLLCRV